MKSLSSHKIKSLFRSKWFKDRLCKKSIKSTITRIKSNLDMIKKMITNMTMSLMGIRMVKMMSLLIIDTIIIHES